MIILEAEEKKIAQPGSAVAGGLTLPRYIETMMPQYGNNSIKRWTRRGHYALEREDLVGEAALVLVEIWNKYAHVKPENELRRMGTRGFFNHIGNVFHRCRAFGAGDAKMVYSDAPAAEDGAAARHPADAVMLRRGGGRAEPQLDSLIARESAETLAVPDFRGPSAAAVRKIFSDVVRAIKEDDGYSLVDAAGKLNYNQRGEVRMNNAAAGGPESPDTERTEVIDKPATVERKPKAPAKVAKAKAEKKADRMTREESDARVGMFKAGQRVKYKGGGRTAIKAGTAMTVLGSVKSKGRLYVRCRTADETNVTLSSALVSKI